MVSSLWPVIVAALTCCAPTTPPPAIEAPLAIEPAEPARHPQPAKPAEKPAEVKPPRQALQDAINTTRQLRNALDRYSGPKPQPNAEPDLP